MYVIVLADVYVLLGQAAPSLLCFSWFSENLVD